ncbi:MAG: pyridoxal phosphate-dependent aminotransferase, partial [Thermoplasmatales archaeon]|nr:pyridoxal phosphate-dependent aminotransferase [Thermoplasmatales archaeon]
MALEELVGSASLEILDLVLKKVSAGENVISLAIGEPVFDTPKEINDAAIDGINSGMTHYISSYGSPEFREAVVSKV